MKNIIFALFLLHSVLFSQWNWMLDFPQNEYPQEVIILDTALFYVVTETFQGDTSYIYRFDFYNGLEKLPMQNFMYGQRITCIAAHDSIYSWVGTAIGNIYNTTNGGISWNLQISTGGTGFINDIRFSETNPDYGYANSDPPSGAGTPFKIFKTTNGGFNWTEYSYTTNTQHVGAIKSSWVTDENHYWMGLYCNPQLYSCPYPSADIILTTNGGLNWQINYIPSYSHFISNVVFQSNTFGLCTPWDVLPVDIYKSTNGGMSWYLNNTTSHNQTIMTLDWAEGTTDWYYCTLNNDSVYKSTNNGQTWFPMETENNNEQFSSLDVKRIRDGIFGFAVTYQGSMLGLYNDTIHHVGITNQGNEIPGNFSLYQNYPNPFNPVTKIKFQIPLSRGVSEGRGVLVKLHIYDALGREIAMLVNEQLTPGTYEVGWDGSNYPSGVYFYRLEAGNFSETKKMVLIK